MIKIKIFWLINLFLILFCFTTINRTFRIFNFDLRYLLVLISIVLIFSKLKKIKLYNENVPVVNLYMYILIVGTTVSYYNGVNSSAVFYDLIILHLSNFIFFIVFYLYKEIISINILKRYTLLSIFILSLSIFLVHIGVDIKGFIEENNTYIVRGEDNFNLLFQSFRISGFAEDSNYASLFSLIGIILLSRCDLKLSTKIIFFISYIYIYIYSFSKTITITIFFIFLIFLLDKLLKNIDYSIIIKIFYFSLLLFTILFSVLDIKMSLATIINRLVFWNYGFNLFLKSYIFGLGTSSFRYFFNEYIMFKTGNSWIVHPHNSFISILSEYGLFGIYFYTKLLFSKIKNIKKISFYLIISLLIFNFSFDTTYLQIFVLLLIIIDKENEYA